MIAEGRVQSTSGSADNARVRRQDTGRSGVTVGRARQHTSQYPLHRSTCYSYTSSSTTLPCSGVGAASCAQSGGINAAEAEGQLGLHSVRLGPCQSHGTKLAAGLLIGASHHALTACQGSGVGSAWDRRAQTGSCTRQSARLL
jgi:hypothetical protein